MRRQLIPAAALAALAAVAVPASAPAAVVHVVQPGETLWSIAAANNYTTRSLAAFNGLSESSPVILGATIRIPGPGEAAAAAAAASRSTTTSASTTGGTTRPAASIGGYRVRLGDTLSAIAARNGISVARLAAYNGLAREHRVIAGTRLGIPTGAAASAPATQTTFASSSRASTSTTGGSPTSGATSRDATIGGSTTGSSTTSSSTASRATTSGATVQSPTPTVAGPRVDAATIQQIAAANGVSPSLATAIAYQESGFNNDMVSSASARGVMQVIPGTWSFIQRNLAARPLNPNLASDNIHAGTLYLKRLHALMGSDDLAVASYYQGPASVRRIGMLPETRRYVNNVRALRTRFGG